jgi:putative colanic acid biosynthesis acetyltransferase WcaF
LNPRSQASLGPLARDLRRFSGSGYDRGRPVLTQVAWFAVQHLVFKHWWCPARFRPPLLRLFGASIGDRVLIRHGVRVHLPWKLHVGHDSWIGEDAWLINLESISIGSNVCISQGAMLCTGSHDHRSVTFEYDNGPITIDDGAWIATRATVLRGVTVGNGSVVGATALAFRDVAPGTVVVAAKARDVGPAASR